MILCTQDVSNAVTLPAFRPGRHAPRCRLCHVSGWLLLLSSVLFSGACAKPAMLEPPRIHPRPRRSFYAGGVRVERVSIVADDDVRPSKARAFREALKRHLEGSFPRRDAKLPPIGIDVTFDVSHSSHRTYFFDVVAGFYLGLFPLTPQWGYARSKAALLIDAPAAAGALPSRLSLRLYSSKAYSIIAYSWFRSGPLDRAYRQSNRDAFEGLAARLDHWWPYHQQGQTWWSVPPLYSDVLPGRVRFDFDIKGKLRIAGVARHRDAWRLIDDETIDQEQQADREDDRRPATRPPRSIYWTYLAALSGLEGGYFAGGAWVSTTARLPNGQAFTIASGNATSKGFKIRLFNPPKRSKFFIHPTLGFFSLDVDVEDLAGDIPLGRMAGAKDIGAVGSDPLTGAPIDLGASHVYSMKLRSGYFGQRIGGTLVVGNARTQLFFSLEGGLNIIEWRYTDVRIGSYGESAHSAAFFRSFAGRLLVGIVHRPWHLGLRCEGNWEYYRKFSFPRAIPFEGPVTYNSRLQAYERKEIKVDAAAVHTANVYCGASIVY